MTGGALSMMGSIDACAFMLVPFMLLAVIGFFLAINGLELWWLGQASFTLTVPAATPSGNLAQLVFFSTRNMHHRGVLPFGIRVP